MIGSRKAPSMSTVRVTFLLALACFSIAPTLEAQNVTVTNVFQQHYNYIPPIGDQNCSAGYDIPAGQYDTSTYHLERGHAIHHLDPKNAANDYWVYWAHFDNSSYSTAEVAIFKSTTECGPYILQSQISNPYSTDGHGYGFQPGGWQSRDENIFRDGDTQTYNADGTVASYAAAYFVTASNDLGTQMSSSGSTCNFANDSDAVFKMTPDYLGIDPTTNPSTNGANWIFVCDQREAPVMFKQGSAYFIVVSQAAGWYPSQGAYGASGNPLTGWTPDPVPLGNRSTFGLQGTDGIVIQGTQATTYVLVFDHLGGNDTKNPSSNEFFDTGAVWLPLFLDGTAKTATLNWYSSWSVDMTTGVLTLPTLPNLAIGSTASSTVATAAAMGGSTFVPGNAVDGNYTTRWAGSASGSSSFNAATRTGTALCPVTNATSATTCSPSLVVDLGSVQPVQEIDLSFYMVHGSEVFYKYKVEYSSDGATWNTLDYTTFASAGNAILNNISNVPFSNNTTYGFNALPVNFSARYVAVTETGVVQQNTSTPFYGPGLYEIAVIQSTAPQSPHPVTVTATPSISSVAPSNSFTVNVAVTGPTGQPMPTGYVQLSAPGYVSETFGLVNGAVSFTIPAGAMAGGMNTITASFRADPTGAPIYGIGMSMGSGSITVTAPAAPTNVAVAKTAPGSLTVSWAASTGASSYVVNRSSDGGNTYTPAGATSSLSFVDTGLNNDSTTYCYTVAAVNGAGTGPASASVCSTATANFPVSGLAVTQSGPGALTVSYNSLTGVSGYLIKRSVSGSAFTSLTTTTSTSYVDENLATDGTQYCYTVAAVFGSTPSVDSAPVCSAASINFVPTNVAVTPWFNSQLYVSWLAPGTSSTNYVVKRSVNGGAFTTIATQSTLTYVDTNLTNYSNVYCYVVDAVVGDVSSPDSFAGCASPSANFISVPNNSFEMPNEQSALWQTGTSVSGGSWTFVGAAGANSGNVSGISINKTGTWTNGNAPAPAQSQVAYICGAGTISQTISGFTPGNTYTVWVAASERQNRGQTMADPFTVNVNGQAVGTIAPPQSIGYYRDYSVSFVATAASEAIAFVGTTNSSSTINTVLLDNVRIQTTGTATSQIAVSAVMIAQGTAFAAVTATETFSGPTPPSGPLIFQVNQLDQVASTCNVSGNTETCTANYPTSKLSAGADTISVRYAGDPVYAATTGTGQLTVANITGRAPASGDTCNGTYNGAFNGNITVSTGQNCMFLNGSITGNVAVNGGNFGITGGTISGNVQIQGATAFTIGQDTTITGNLAVQNIGQDSVINQISGARINGNLDASYNAAPIQFGPGNFVGGNAGIQNNTAPITVYNNAIQKTLSCSNNISITGTGNTAQKESGQCSGF